MVTATGWEVNPSYLLFSHLLSPKLARMTRRCVVPIAIAMSSETTGHQKGWFNEKLPNR